MYENEEEDKIKDLIEDMEMNGVFDDLDRSNRADLETCSEWYRKEYTHLHTILEAWAYGIISSDAYYREYHLPDGFDAVFNHISKRLTEKFPKEVVVEVSLCEILQWLREWAMECPEFILWNDLPGKPYVTRYSPVATEPEFIDLNVPSHNAALFVRDKRRHDRAFDRRFEREHGHLEE